MKRIIKLQYQSETQQDEVPDIVKSLLGAGEPVPNDDVNGQASYYSYIEKRQ